MQKNKKENITGKIQELIDGHIQKIKSEETDLRFKLNQNLPNIIKRGDQDIIEEKVIKLENLYDLLFPFVKNIKQGYIKDITEKTTTCAIYLLLCHIFDTWRAVFLLARNGMNIQMMNSIRHIREILDLVSFFIIEEENSEDLQKWFNGEIISNEKSRKSIRKFLESDPNLKNEIDFYNMKSYIYTLLSQYPHGGYCIILESVDVFNKDYDFKKYSNFHFIKKSMSLVNGIMDSTMIVMKQIFQYLKDMDGYQKVDEILKKQLPQLDKKEFEDMKRKFPKN